MRALRTEGVMAVQSKRNRVARTASWPLSMRLLALGLLAAALIAPLVIWQEELGQIFANRDQVVAELRAVGVWGPLALIGLIVAQTVVAPIPGVVLNLVAGYLYGLGLGFLYSWLGLAVGSALAMGLARFAGRPVVERLVTDPALSRFDRLAQKGGLPFFLLAFLIPGLPDDLLCFVAGLTRLPLRILWLLSVTARVPGLFVAVWLGAYAERAPWQAWAIGAGLAVLLLLAARRLGPGIQAFVLRQLEGREGGDSG
ncbi:MAG: TVP38/TMEM64 family protein [Anaerolineae bacterium]|nr:TVP38/TMEM64 family protein [Anaerolineae bacterium]